MVDVLSEIMTGNRYDYNCHLIPQWDFAGHVDKILPFWALSSPDGPNILAEHFGIVNVTLPKEIDGVLRGEA